MKRRLENVEPVGPEGPDRDWYRWWLNDQDEEGMPRILRPGDWLVAWLNDGPEGEQEKTRILELIPRLQALWTYTANRTHIDCSGDAGKAMFALLESVDECTERYKTSPLFDWNWASGGVRVRRAWHDAMFDEQRAITAIEELVREGTFDRLTFCAGCGTRWVFRSRSNHIYCSRHCRQKHYEATERRKADRLLYMRYYYAMFQSSKAPKKKLSFEQWLKLQQVSKTRKACHAEKSKTETASTRARTVRASSGHRG